MIKTNKAKKYSAVKLIGEFSKYYKPHLGLFIFDLTCAFLMTVCNLVYPTIARSIINVYAPNKLVNDILLWSGVLLGIFLVKAVLNYCVTYWGHTVGVRIQGDMRLTLFTHLEKLPFSYYDETKVGSIMSRVTNDLFEISELAHHGPEDLLLSLLAIIGSLAMITTINPWLALIVFALLPPMFFVVITLRKQMRATFTEGREKTAAINASVESSISGIRVSKSYTAEDHEIQKFAVTNEEYKEVRKKNYKIMGKFHTGMTLCMDILYLATLVAGGLFYSFDLIDVGDMTAYILYISMLLNPIRTFVTLFEQIEEGLTGFARFSEIMKIAPEKDAVNPVKVDKLNGDIVFDHVTFTYRKDEKEDDLKENNRKNESENGEIKDDGMVVKEDERVGNIRGRRKNVINDLSLKINRGETVALVGPSGGGKTTLCNLIPRFYDIDEGKIYIDSIDIKNIALKDLRRNIGIVQQDVFLYGGSVKENIAYGNLDASDDEIIKAAKLANIHDFICSLPDGYDTYVGERGVKLSGGQKQRVSIARAFLKNPPILILDEATSALDNVTELQIQDSLEKLSKGRTTIVVAHRLSTIKNADEIIVITEKGVVERGSHNELLKIENGVYKDLYERGLRS